MKYFANTLSENIRKSPPLLMRINYFTYPCIPNCLDLIDSSDCHYLIDKHRYLDYVDLNNDSFVLSNDYIR